MLTKCSHLTANPLVTRVIPRSNSRDTPRNLPQSVVIVTRMDGAT
jgi:hypothetical protein